MKKPPGTYCALPWNSVNIRNNGDLRICCNANSYTKTKGILTKEDGTPYNAGRDDWNEARNSALLKEVRATMLAGKWHPECERCKQEEDAGQMSRRMFDTLTWAEVNSDTTMEKIIPLTQVDGTLDTDKQPIEFIDIRYGNFCNLKCRMCGPTDSHSWYEDFTKAYETSHFDDTHGTVYLTKNEKGRLETSDYDWFVDSTNYTDNFERYAQKAKRLYIVGGEPLIIKEHQDTLQRLVDTGVSKNMQLEYNTNLTNITDSMLELWSQFEDVKLGASIDGLGKVFNYQRYPGNWDSVLKNIRTIEEKGTDNIRCIFSFTVTNINVFHLPEFMKWKLESGLTKFNPYNSNKPIISYHMCHGPKRYNIKSLPPELKLEVESVYEEYKEWIRHTDYDDHIKYHFVHILDRVVDFMFKQDTHEHFTGKMGFVELTNRLDKLRNQDILDIVPQYEKYFKK